jgi:hypothetical protein
MGALRVQNATRIFADAQTSVSISTASPVTAGNLVVITVARFTPLGPNLFVVGDISKTAGSSALADGFLLDKGQQVLLLSTQYFDAAIFSAKVTTGGTLTVQVGGGDSGDYWDIGITEYPDVDTTASRVEASNSVTGTATPVTSGNATSAGAALFIGCFSIAIGDSGTITPQAAWLELWESQDGTTHNTGAAAEQIVTGGTTDQAEWTYTGAPGSPWVAVVAVYKVATATGRNPVPMGFIVG